MHDPQRSERGYTIHKPIDGKQTLDATPFFTLVWEPAAAEALGDEGLVAFRLATTGVMRYLRDVHSSQDADIMTGVMDLNTVLLVPGTTISYADRNTSYTNVDGTWMASPVNPSRDAEVPFGPVQSIQNPLNHPSLNPPA